MANDADNPILTPNLLLQEMGVTHTMAPAKWNKLINIVDAAVSPTLDTATFTATPTGVVLSNAAVPLRRLRLTLSAVRVSVTAANDFGSTALFTWPNTNISVLNARVNLTGTKDGTGIVAAATPGVALGTVAASNATLSSTMIDTVDLVGGAGTLAFAVQKNGPATRALRQISAGATNKIFLNVGIAITADGYIDFTGTVDVDYFDLGLFS